ncbi:MAG: sortase, partial [Ilumatobacter sp.]|nr:sortase [Ilumatobacter sp.]
GDVNANLVTVKIGDGGHVDVVGFVACDMIVDVLGYYEPVTGAVRAGRFIGLGSAKRAIDTRASSALLGANSFTTVDVTQYVPADASSVVLNLTTTSSVGPNFFTAEPYSVTTKPTTSSLNVTRAGEIRAVGVIVPVSTVGGKRRIKVYALHPAEIIVDITGYFTSESSPPSTDGLFVPVTPVRLTDTRDPGKIGRLWPGWVTEATLPASAAEASAVVLNVTGVLSRGAGYLTVAAARQPLPRTSNVNFSAPFQTVPNHVITPVTVTHGVQIFSSHGAHVIADMAGYFTGTPKIPQLAEHVNPPPPAAPPQWVLTIPKLGLFSTVRSGDPNHITDSGYSWHWDGTGFMGEADRHVALFAHRTESGAPYRYLDRLVNGDELLVQTGDGRLYTYRVVRRDLTNAANANILAATQFHPGATLSLIACTVGHDRSKSRWPDIWAPTSLKYRIVVTGELVGWREV